MAKKCRVDELVVAQGLAPDLETARQVVAGTRGKARGKMIEGHFEPDDAFRVAMAATIHSLTLQAC